MARGAGGGLGGRGPVRPDQVGGLLVWGDPSLYDSHLRIVERILERGTLPGTTRCRSQPLAVPAARHRVALLHRSGSRSPSPTGRWLAETVRDGADNLVVMLDYLTCWAPATATGTSGWGANLDTSDEAVVAGRLAEVLPAIETSGPAARATRGWAMDTYLLRRR